MTTLTSDHQNSSRDHDHETSALSSYCDEKSDSELRHDQLQDNHNSENDVSASGDDQETKEAAAIGCFFFAE